MQINPEDYAVVSVTHNLASHVGGWVGKLDLDVNVLNNKASYTVTHNKRIKYDGPSSITAAEIYNAIIAAQREAQFGPEGVALVDEAWNRLEPLIVDYAKHLSNVNFWDGTQLNSQYLTPAYASKDRLQAAIEGLVVRKNAA